MWKPGPWSRPSRRPRGLASGGASVNRSPAATPRRGDATCDYRIVRDRDRFRYSIHAVHYDDGSSTISAWTPDAVTLCTGTPAELEQLVELVAEALARPILDRDDLADVLQVFPEPIQP